MTAEALSPGQASLVRISSQAAQGDLTRLRQAIEKGLAAGLTVSQVRAALEQLYAYCGFPRSLNALGVLQAVVQERGLDPQGSTYQPEPGGDRYERGRATLFRLTGVPQPRPAPGFGEFSPEIDRFLKEHLFADVFDNPLLNDQERELVTVAALASTSGVEPQLKSHLGIARHTGVTDAQLSEVAGLIQDSAGLAGANRVRRLLGEAPAANPDVLVRVAQLEIDPAAWTEYLAILAEEARQSVAVEPGVVGILPLTREADPGRVTILEVYRDRAAYEAHLLSPHFLHYKTATAAMVRHLQLEEVRLVDGSTLETIFAKFR